MYLNARRRIKSQSLTSSLVVVEGAARNMKLMQLLVVITFMIMYLFALSRKLVILFQYKLFYCSDEG